MSLSVFQPYVDGWPGVEGQEITVIPRPKFPCKEDQLPETHTRQYERDYTVHPILFEPKIADLTSWTNLLLRSEDFTNASWTKVNLTPSAGTLVSPDGRAVMNKLLETTTNAEHSAAQAATVAAVPMELSAFASAGLTREWIRIAYTDSAATTFSGFFNVASGLIGTLSAGVTAKIVPMGRSQYRAVISFTPAAGAGTVKFNVANSSSSISYAGSTSAGLNLWGVQFGAGVDSPYISTTTAARTILAPNRDKVDPFSYLLREDEPDVINSSQATVHRVFSRIPLTRVVQSSLRFPKPTISGNLPTTVGSYVVAQPDPTLNAYDAYLRQVVSSDSGADLGIGGDVLGGTYTVSFDGDTTSALAYNATAGALQTALNTLASVTDRGGVTVTGNYLSGFTITFTSLSMMTVNIGSLTISGGTLTPVYGAQTANFLQSVNLTPSGGNTITGGSFTITIFGQTSTSIPYDSSVGTVQAAINALSNVAARGGVTLHPAPDPILYGPGQIAFVFGFSYDVFTINDSSLLPAGSTASVALLDPSGYITPFFGRQQSLTFSGATIGDRVVETVSAHGITTAMQIYAKAGDEYFLVAPGTFTVSAADEITFDADSGPVASSLDAISEIGTTVRNGYVPGAFTARCVRTTYYYLPGVTPDVDVAADIVLPTYQGDPDTMLQLIFAGTGTINYEVGDLEQWLGRVLALTVVTLLASDL